jgi:flavin reductase (DIM6/NTAB) family NADH-FMN oxidoreductase RutF
MKRGTPVLRDSLANLDCRKVAAHTAGDHTIFVGEIHEISLGEGSPLIYFRGRYGLCRELPDSRR